MKNIEQYRTNISEWRRDYGYLFEGRKIEREKDRAILKLVFVRHGEKELSGEAETALTKRGIFQTAVLGAKRYEKDSISINYSPTLRTEVSAETTSLSDKINGAVKEEELLGYNVGGKSAFSKEFVEKIMDIKKKMLPANYSELSPEEKKEIDEQAGSKQLAMYLGYDTEKPDEDTLSPRELAQQTAEVVKKYVEAVNSGDQYQVNSLHEIINFTHDFNISSFLKYTVPGYDPSIPIRPGEGFEVLIKSPKNDQGEPEISIYFKDKEYSLNLTVFDERDNQS